jgi:prepilin-type processing-associated H-X9-DG protein
MLLPALGKAREAAKNVVCMSNLIQTYLSIVMYSEDNRGYIPIICANGQAGQTPNTTDWCTWVALLDIGKYLPSGTGLQCPSDNIQRMVHANNNDADYTANKPNRWVSYGINEPLSNYQFGNDAYQGKIYMALSRVNEFTDRANIMPLVGDSCAPVISGYTGQYCARLALGNWPMFTFTPALTLSVLKNPNVYARHSGVGSNVVFVDGHAGVVTVDRALYGYMRGTLFYTPMEWW